MDIPNNYSLTPSNSGSSWQEKVKNFFNVRTLKWLVLVALILLILTILSFWVSRPSFSDKGVQLSIDAPTQASVGDEVSFKVKYANFTKTELRDLRFTFFYPDDSVRLKDGEVDENSIESFTVESLAPGQTGEKEFKSFLIGDRGNIKNSRVNLIFKAGTLKSSFEKTAQASTTITNLPIALSLVAPPNFLSGQKADYILDFRNESDLDISDIRFEFQYPDGFTPTTFSPKPAEGNSVWIVSSLPRNAGSRINISGTLSGNPGDEKAISVTVRRKIGSTFVPYERATASTKILSPLLALTIASDHNTANLGDRIEYTLNYKNISTFTFSGMTLSAKLESSLFDYSSINSRGGFFDDNTRTLTWNAGVDSKLGLLEPQAEGKITFTVKVRDSFPNANPSSFPLKVSAELSTDNVPQDLTAEKIIETATITTKVNSAPTFTQSGYYNDPIYGSSGPYPPKVGSKTFFTVHWVINNSGNVLNNAEIKATLPPGINWEGTAQTISGPGQPEFSSNRSEVSWEIGNIPVGGRYEAVFRVSTIPSSIQEGDPVTLVRNAILNAIDSSTTQDFSISQPELTTSRLVDRQDGRVVD